MSNPQFATHATQTGALVRGIPHCHFLPLQRAHFCCLRSHWRLGEQGSRPGAFPGALVLTCGCYAKGIVSWGFGHNLQHLFSPFPCHIVTTLSLVSFAFASSRPQARRPSELARPAKNQGGLSEVNYLS